MALSSFAQTQKRLALLRLASLKKFAKPIVKSPPVQVFNPTVASPKFNKIFFKPTPSGIPPKVILKPFVPGTGIVFRPPKGLPPKIKQRPGTGIVFKPRLGTGIVFKPPVSKRVNIAGNTINESPSGVSNSVFTNRLKNIELVSIKTNKKTFLIVALAGVALLFFLSK